MLGIRTTEVCNTKFRVSKEANTLREQVSGNNVLNNVLGAHSNLCWLDFADKAETRLCLATPRFYGRRNLHRVRTNNVSSPWHLQQQQIAQRCICCPAVVGPCFEFKSSVVAGD